MQRPNRNDAGSVGAEYGLLLSAIVIVIAVSIVALGPQIAALIDLVL